MARFIIRLYLDAKPSVGIEREIRREGDDRAVLYAQNWLHKHRLSMRYLGLSLDRWSVGVQGAAGTPMILNSGMDDRRIPTAIEEHSRRAASKTKLKTTGSVTSLRPARARIKRSTPARPMSRLAQAVASAKQKVANNGDIPPLGGNPNR